VQYEYTAQATYETHDGDRVTLFRRDDEWVIAWSYSDPHTGTPQLTGFGNSGPQAIDIFVQSRHGRGKQAPLTFDSREHWARGSV